MKSVGKGRETVRKGRGETQHEERPREETHVGRKKRNNFTGGKKGRPTEVKPKKLR